MIVRRLSVHSRSSIESLATSSHGPLLPASQTHWLQGPSSHKRLSWGVFAHPSGLLPESTGPGIAFEFDDEDEVDTKKRLIALMLLWVMPKEGLGETIEALSDIVRFNTLPVLSTPPRQEVRYGSGTLAYSIVRPELILSE